MGVPEQWEVRVGDADRQAAVDQLRVHFSEGRLTLDEYEDRAARAFAARVRADLVPLVADLPVVKVRGSGPPVRPRPQRTTWDLALQVHTAVWVALSGFFLLLCVLVPSATRGLFIAILATGLTVGIHYGIKSVVEDD